MGGALPGQLRGGGLVGPRGLSTETTCDIISPRDAAARNTNAVKELLAKDLSVATAPSRAGGCVSAFGEKSLEGILTNVLIYTQFIDHLY